MLVAACSAGAPAPDAPAVASGGDGQTATVHRGALRQVLLLSGELKAVSSAKISVPASRQRDPVIRWMIEEGEPVQEGDRMVELDTSQIATQLDDRQIELEEAINELNSKEAEVAGEVAQKQFEVDQARINLRKAEIDASIPEDLQSQREYQEFQLALEEAQSALAKVETDFASLLAGSEAEVEVMRIDVQISEREVEQVRQALDTMVLRAPRDGIAVIGENYREGRKFQIGDTSWVGAEVMGVPDLSVMMVDTLMSDVDDGKVTPGMRVVATLDAYPAQHITGYVRTVTPVAQTRDMRSDQRYFRLLVDLEESDPEIMRPGMSVKVEVVTAKRDDELLIPRAALTFDRDTVYAVLEDGTQQPITLGSCSAHACVIASGVSEGTTVRIRSDDG